MKIERMKCPACGQEDMYLRHYELNYADYVVNTDGKYAVFAHKACFRATADTVEMLVCINCKKKYLPSLRHTYPGDTISLDDMVDPAHHDSSISLLDYAILRG